MSAATINISKKLADGTLVAFGGTSYDDLYGNLLALAQGDVAAVEFALDGMRTAIFGTFFSNDAQAVAHLQQNLGAQPVQAQPQQAPWEQPQAAPQQREAAGPPPGLTAPFCQHGQRVYQAGTSKQGKAYKMWKCPSGDRANECPAEWIR